MEMTEATLAKGAGTLFVQRKGVPEIALNWALSTALCEFAESRSL